MSRTGIKLAYLYKTAAIAALLSCYSHAVSWDIQTVDFDTGPFVGASIDMVLDINGVAHVVYFDNSGNLSLIYATNNSGLWDYYTVEQEHFTQNALKAVMAIDSNNVVYIVYPDSEENLVYEKKENGQWNEGTIDDSESLPYGAAINGQGGFYVLYSKVTDMNSNNATLILKTPTGPQVIAEHGNFQSGSLAIDSMSNPHLCYYDAYNNVLKYAVKDGNSWTVETVDANVGDVPSSVWGSASLALDGNDVPHISYVDFTNTDLKYAEKLFGSWAPHLVDNTGYIYQQSAVVVDSNDNVRICYKRIVNGRVLIEHAVGTAAGRWQFSDTIDDFNQLDTAYLTIACDNDDRSHICYTVPSLRTVEYAVYLFCSDPDKNCMVDFFDFSILAQHWLDTGCASDDYCSGADIDKSTVVDNNDLDLLAESWLSCLPGDCY